MSLHYTIRKMSNPEEYTAGNAQFSLSERVLCMHCAFTTTGSTTIMHQEAEFAASAIRLVIQTFSFPSRNFLFLFSQSVKLFQ